LDFVLKDGEAAVGAVEAIVGRFGGRVGPEQEGEAVESVGVMGETHIREVEDGEGIAEEGEGVVEGDRLGIVEGGEGKVGSEAME
jgi:hypothetical protein